MSLAHLASARESGFVPIIGDVSAAIKGPERVSVGDDGSLQVMSYTGQLVPGFPVSVADVVFTTSPVLANITGTNFKEIIVVGRTSADAYNLYAYGADGQLVGSTPLPAEIDYDPTAMLRTGTVFEDVVLGTRGGGVLRLRFENNVFNSTQLLQVNGTVGVTVVGNALAVTSPLRGNVQIYNLQQNNWVLQSTFNTPQPLAYPVTFDGTGILYGVTVENNLIAISRANGAMQAGFPVRLSNIAAASVVVADVESTAGMEVIVPIVDGSTAVVRTNGQVVAQSNGKIFIGKTPAGADTLSRGQYDILRTLTGRLVSNGRQRLFSYLSRVKAPTLANNVLPDGDMERNTLAPWRLYGRPTTAEKSSQQYTEGTQSMRIVSVGSGGGVQQVGIPVTSGQLYKFSFKYRLSRGVIRTLFGLNDSNVPFDGIRSDITTPLNTWATFERLVQFPDNPNNLPINLVFNTRDADVYIDEVILEPIGTASLVRDSDMEESTTSSWRAYGSPVTFQKTADQFRSGQRSTFISSVATGAGFQQVNVPVRPGKWYRYTLNYKLLQGEIRTLLGINSSNSDFENRLAIIGRPADEWRQYSRQFRVPDNFRGSFNVVMSTRNARAYFDDVTIEEISPPQELVVDGGMEIAGVGSWLRYGNPLTLEKVAALVRTGAQSLHLISAANTGAQQANITLLAGRQYRLRAWYRVAGGTLIPRMSTNNANEDFEFPINDPREPLLGNTNNQWQQYERVFTVPANYNDMFRLVFMLSNADFGPPYQNLPQGEAWIDDVTIELLP